MKNYPWILPLDSPNAELAWVGGKAASLARMARAGFPVPGGFFITTQAYRDFVTANKLGAPISVLLVEADINNPESLERVSQEIRDLFHMGVIPPELAAELRGGYQRLGEKAVAVRSSATAEDLPEMSFAGQQDTYLNVCGSKAVLEAVVNCWSSLWTGRAIGYRLRNRVSEGGAALAVVVQEMIASQVSGVMFTANPLNGLRSETVIDAVFGLGEALVSGQVEPDHYVVDPVRGVVLSRYLGRKEISIHARPGGGSQVIHEDRAGIQAIPEAEILNLTQLGRKLADLYGFPQDIEWGWLEDNLYLLQSRPITTLFPLPEGLPVEPLRVFFSFAAVQGMLDPVTPIGRDALCEIFAMGASLFGVRVTRETQGVLFTAGERLWVNFTAILRNSIGRRIVPKVLNFIEPSIRQAVEQIWDDPRLQPGKPGISAHARMQLARFMIPVAGNVILNLNAPRQRREMIIRNGERLLEVMRARCAAIQGDRWEKLARRADLLADMAGDHLPRTFRLFVSGVAAGMAAWNLLDLLATSDGQGESTTAYTRRQELTLQVTRGMPYNPTTEMDLSLWRLAKEIRRDEDTLRAFQENTPTELSARLHQGDLPLNGQRLVEQFLERYGGRGLSEIDLGRTRWAQDPTHVFEMLVSFLQIEDEARAPDVVFKQAAGSAEQAAAELIWEIRKTRHGWIKAWAAGLLIGRVRQLMGLRESPKFFAVRMMWLIQGELLKSGNDFVNAGELKQADDLFFLSFSELEAMAGRQETDWKELIAERREVYQRELMRRQVPRLLLSDGRAFYAGLSEAVEGETAISGSPVSPGSVEGRVRVVFDPRKAGLLPGEILVCPGTDPSWTPLFLAAAGLVMEVGGMMTHGAVVAREYGIPAVVGVDQATSRLKNGASIRLNGSSGQIVILENLALDT